MHIVNKNNFSRTKSLFGLIDIKNKFFYYSLFAQNLLILNLNSLFTKNKEEKYLQNNCKSKKNSLYASDFWQARRKKNTSITLTISETSDEKYKFEVMFIFHLSIVLIVNVIEL